jgi:hypothetical protein
MIDHRLLIAEAYGKLHKRRVMHVDLKADHILGTLDPSTNSLRIRLIDFEGSYVVEHGVEGYQLLEEERDRLVSLLGMQSEGTSESAVWSKGAEIHGVHTGMELELEGL